MPGTPWLPDPLCLRLVGFAVDGDHVTITVATTPAEAACPLCHQYSEEAHSRYVRRVADLPWGGTIVRLRLHLRRFFCRTPACPRAIFAGRLPTVAAPYARRTTRLTALVRSIGFAAGGELGSGLAASCGCATSPDSVLRAVEAASPKPLTTPRVLGVDDWAWCRGVTYGTILVDLERRHVLDLLPDRTVATFVAWLRAHPGIQIICRDRGPLYAEGAKLGAPNAQQVVDRFHLMRNWSELLERIGIRHRTRLYWTEWVEPLPPSVYTPLPAIVLRARPENEARKQRVRAERLARYQAIRAEAAKGICFNEIARALHVHWKTVQSMRPLSYFPKRRLTPPGPRFWHLTRPICASAGRRAATMGSAYIERLSLKGILAAVIWWRTWSPSGASKTNGPARSSSKARPQSNIP
jgi:transposase